MNQNQEQTIPSEVLEQVAETFDTLEADGLTIPETSNVDTQKYMKEFEQRMANFMAAKANHQPGKEFTLHDGVTYIVGAYPHEGMWIKKEKANLINPNLENKSVRRKIQKNPSKYIINN